MYRLGEAGRIEAPPLTRACDSDGDVLRNAAQRPDGAIAEIWDTTPFMGTPRGGQPSQAQPRVVQPRRARC